MRVAEVMTPRSELVTATVPGSREDVLELLQKRQFSSVPVIKQTPDGEVYRGLVSREGLIEQPDEDQLAMLLEEVPAVTAETTLAELAEQMVTTGARRVPVVDGKLTGIVTVTDMIRAIGEEDISTDHTVEEFADGAIHTTYAGTPLRATAQGLWHADEAYAVVLDGDGDMAGIITEADLISVAEVVQGHEGTGDSIANEDSEWAWEGIKAVGNRYLPTRNVELPDAPASEYMTEDVVTVTGRRTVAEAARRMISNDIEQIPLVQGDNLVGIVKDRELLEAVYA